MPSWRPGKMPRKRPGNDPPHTVASGQDLPGHPAIIIQGLHGHHRLMGCNLEYAVRGSIDDQVPRAHMLLPIVLNHLGTGVRPVAQDATACLLPKGGQHLLRESIRIGGQGIFRNESCNLPVPDGSIFPSGSLRHTGNPGCMAIGKTGNPAAFCHLHAIYLEKPHPLQVRQVETGTRRYAPQGIHMDIPIGRRICHLPDPETVQYNQKYSLHMLSSLLVLCMPHAPFDKGYRSHMVIMSIRSPTDLNKDIIL